MSRICVFKQSIFEDETSFKDYTSKCAYCIGNFPEGVYTKCEAFLHTGRNQEKGCDFRKKIRRTYDHQDTDEKWLQNPTARAILEDIARRRREGNAN
jgi:hypothetical protein